MLINLWRKLFGGCDHKYQLIKEIDVEYGGGIIATKMILQCKDCGVIKVKRV